MKKTFRLFVLLILSTLLLVPTRSAQAQDPTPDGEGKVIFGSNYTVKSGDTFEGDLVVIGGNVTIEEDAILDGDLVVIGGTVKSNGETSGSMVVVGGQISLEESARVAKDVVTIGGQLDKAEGAEVKGDIVNNAAPNITIPTAKIPPTAPAAPGAPSVSLPNVHIYNPFGTFMRVFGSALLAGLIGILATLFFRNHLDHVSQAVISQPLMAGGIGLLSFVVIFLVAATLIGIPLAILGLIVLGFAWLFGIVSMGQEIGDRLAKALGQNWTPVIATGLGTFVLVFIIASFQFMQDSVPFFMACVTWIIPIAVGWVAIGAVLLTRFGTRAAQVPMLTVKAPPIDSGQTPPVG